VGGVVGTGGRSCFSLTGRFEDTLALTDPIVAKWLLYVIVERNLIINWPKRKRENILWGRPLRATRLFQKGLNHMETPIHFFKAGGELTDYPGWYKIDGGTEEGAHSWSVVRKPDGTWWWVAVHHIFPPGGGNLRIDLGDQITDDDTLTQCEENYKELVRKLEGRVKEGDRVRVIKSGTTGVVKGVGSVPGVPKLVNVAYDGGGGCNHMPEELEKIEGPTLNSSLSSNS